MATSKAPVSDDQVVRYRETKDTHRLCRRCQLVMTANPEQVCDVCSGGVPLTTPDEKYANSNVARLIHFVTWAESQTLTVRPVDGDGEIPVPYLTWRRAADGRLSLTLDHRLGVDLPAMTEYAEDSIIEFIANAIAIGAGYASIYYTKRKMPFRG